MEEKRTSNIVGDSDEGLAIMDVMRNILLEAANKKESEDKENKEPKVEKPLT